MCVGVLLGLMTGCVAPIYRCNPTYRDRDKEEGESADEVHIKICHPYQCQLSSGSSNTSDNDRRRNSIDSNDAKEMEQVVQEAKPVSLEGTPSLNWHRTPGIIDDRSTKVVQAQIEVHPAMSSPTTDETLESTAPVLQPGHNCSHNERTKKLPSIKKKMKTFKRILVCSSEKSMVPKGSETDESRKSNRVLAAQSTMLEKSGQVRTLPSIRVSAIPLETRPQDDGASTKQNDSDKYSESRKESKESSPRRGASQEMAKLINRQSVNGKLMCDVRINGLAMNQSDLLNLLEATEGKTRSVSMMTTEEAQIISIKFHRRKNDNGMMQNEDSQKQSGVNNLAIPPIYVSDYSVNDTSYRGLPKMKKNAPNCHVCHETRRNTFWKAKIT